MDGTLVQAPKYAGVGYDSQHKRYGTNISLLTEKNGLPPTNMTFKGNRNDIVASGAHHEQATGRSQATSKGAERRQEL